MSAKKRHYTESQATRAPRTFLRRRCPRCRREMINCNGAWFCPRCGG